MEFTVGKIVSGTLDVIKSRFGPLLGILGIYFGAIIAMFVVLGVGVGAVGLMQFAGSSQANPAMGLAGMGAGFLVFLVLFYVVYLLVAMAQMASLNAMASPLQQLQIGQALSAGIRSAPTLLGVMVLFLVAYFACALVFGLIGGVLSMLGTAAAVIGVIVVLPVLVYLGCRVSLVVPIVAVERVANPITAITRSWSLTRDRVLTIFLTWLCLVAAMVVLIGLLILPVYGSLSSLQSSPPGAASFGALGFVFVGAIVVGVLIAIVEAVLMSVMHALLSGSTGVNLRDTFA